MFFEVLCQISAEVFGVKILNQTKSYCAANQGSVGAECQLWEGKSVPLVAGAARKHVVSDIDCSEAANDDDEETNGHKD